MSPALQADCLPFEPPGKPQKQLTWNPNPVRFGFRVRACKPCVIHFGERQDYSCSLLGPLLGGPHGALDLSPLPAARPQAGPLTQHQQLVV